MFHPFFGPLLRLRVRAALRVKGYGFFDINNIMDGYDDELVPIAAAGAKVNVPSFQPADGTVGALGDGTIIQAILDFLKSPEGQAFIFALIKMLIAAFAGM